jgi:hypothetical protein
MTPVSTDTPHSVMKPTPAVIDSGISRSHSDNTPPVSASGTPLNTSAASFGGTECHHEQRRRSAAA